MVPAPQGGKHCAHCAKNIRDFRQTSDRDLWKLYQKEGKLCGLFRPDQLERPILSESKPSPVRGMAAALTIGAATTATTASAQQATMQVVDAQVELAQLLLGHSGVVVESSRPGLHERSSDRGPQEQTIKGRFYDAETKEPLPFVNVQLFEDETAIVQCVTDFDGYFSVPYSELEGHLVDKISGHYIGYETAEKHFNPPLPAHKLQEAIDDLGLALNMDTVELLGVVHVEKRAPWWKRLWWKLRY